MNRLTREEQLILRDFEADALQPVPAMQRAIKRYRQYAEASLHKPRSINIRVGERDLARIKSLAAEQGVPYQTLISVLIHEQSLRRMPRTGDRTPTLIN